MAIREESTQISATDIGQMAAPGASRAANPAALTVEQLARALGVAVETIRRHVEEGAPAGESGTINLIHHAAWLNKRLGSIDGD
jgi:predicted transcriptional regulator